MKKKTNLTSMKTININPIKRKPNINRYLGASLILLILLILGSCKVGQKYERPQFDDISEEEAKSATEVDIKCFHINSLATDGKENEIKVRS